MTKNYLMKVFFLEISMESFPFGPTALIPFCQFQGSMSVMGVNKPNFSAPVCNSFQAKIRNDQLCYTVDPNIYRVDKPFELTLLLDYNEEREISLYEDNKENKHENHLTLTVKEAQKRFVIIETIGKVNRLKSIKFADSD